jgi:DNA-binding beta-propeller fold protein YncE
VVTLGTGEYTYEASGDEWGILPDGWTYKEATSVAVDANDNVYIFNRGEHPVIVLDRDGKFLRSWGEGPLAGAHGAAVGPDESVYFINAGDNTIEKFTLQGTLLMTLGEKGRRSERLSGKPFGNPTHVAVDQTTGDIYVSDGYSNAAVHKFTPDGKLLFSWGQSGTGPGEFSTVHNIASDGEGNVYVADRENQRVQVFDSSGKYLAQWQNLAKAACIAIDKQDGIAYVGEFYAGIPDNPQGWGNWTGKRLGPRVTVLDLDGNVLARVGEEPKGLAPGQFIAPHGIAIDSRGDIYVAEVSYATYGVRQDPPREVRSLQKLVRRPHTALDS